MAFVNRPRFVSECEWEKQFITNHCRDYCKICPERFRKITTNLRCEAMFVGDKVNPDKLDRELLFYCIIEGEQETPAYKTRDRKVQRSIAIKDLHALYE